MTNFAKNAHTKAPMALLACTLALVLFGCNAGQPDVSSTPVGAAPTATSATSATVSAGSQGDLITIDPSASISGGTEPVPVGQAAPGFSLPGIDGKTYTLSALKGKAVVLEFIATWCPHCQADAPTFNKLYNAYHSKGVEIIDINATPRGHDNKSPATTNDLLWFRDTYKVEFPMLFDKTLKSSADYGILGYPSVYIVDKDGKVAYQPPADHVPTYEEITGVLDGLLK